MDYEKKYKEALERARALRNEAIEEEYAVDYIKDYETIFPELRESEDERIRKEIIGYLNSRVATAEETELLYFKRWIAYLEKQKDSKWSPSEDEMGVLYKLCYISNQVTDEDDTELTRLYQDLKREYFNGHSFENMFPSEKQKEQKPEEKPINWTELTWKDINELERIINNVHYEFRNGIGQESFGKEVLERFRDTKDDAEIETCEQKPAEWSEDDEEMLEYIIGDVNDAKQLYTPRAAKEMADKEISWLKSLRSRLKSSGNWKPSEEQMMKEAVDGTVHHCATAHYVSVDEVQLTERLKQFQDGDKVKVIIVRSDETSLGLKKQG